MPIDADVRERLRTAQRAESEAIAAVQKAQAAEADAGARLDEIILRHRAELSKARHTVHVAQAALVRTSGLERAAVLLDVSARMLKLAVRETAPGTSLPNTRNKMPAARTAQTTAPTDT